MKTDILIVGTGCAGLYCALNIPQDREVLMISKSDAESSDSFLAQGGICVQHDDDDYESFLADTLKAGHYENDKESVDIMIRSSRDVIDDLIGYGVDFQKQEDGTLLYTKEGAHSHPRILFHEDVTGREITSKLLARVRERHNVEIVENCTMLDLLCEGNRCQGIVAKMPDGSLELITADEVVLACGGIGGIYEHSTNYHHLTGDAVAAAIRHGVEVEHLNYVQIHPTTLYSKNKESRSFLISESVRGEGAKLYNARMERFADELLPRDLLTKAIYKQMELDGTEYVWEDLRTIPRDELLSHFPNIIAKCKEEGYDVTKECIPVVPAQHYFMGGVKVDHEGRTSMEHLYAIGETACNGVHGRNRLASNSLLESLVWAKRAAVRMQQDVEQDVQEVDLTEEMKQQYADIEKLAEENKQLLIKAIEKENEYV